MVYFFHHYELPAILQQARIQQIVNNQNSNQANQDNQTDNQGEGGRLTENSEPPGPVNGEPPGLANGSVVQNQQDLVSPVSSSEETPGSSRARENFPDLTNHMASSNDQSSDAAGQHKGNSEQSNEQIASLSNENNIPSEATLTNTLTSVDSSPSSTVDRNLDSSHNLKIANGTTPKVNPNIDCSYPNSSTNGNIADKSMAESDQKPVSSHDVQNCDNPQRTSPS